MTVPARWRYKFTWFGSVHNGTWQTSCMFRTDITGAPFQTDLDNGAISINSLGSAFKTRFAALNASQCSWTGLRIDLYAPGSLAVAATTSQLFTTPVSGGQTVESAPASALVTTINSAHPGRTGRGRLYWPMTGPYTVAANPSGLPASQVTGIATDFAAFLTSIGAIGHVTSFGSVNAVIQSLKDGQLYDCVGVTVDGRPDRQEHRERRLTFAKSSHAV